ncbi:MAG: serine/threonine protein kinase [Planctomycetes bacterium]|nr:serine/threonine protein kinase [Planctomycetota bacterium]
MAPDRWHIVKEIVAAASELAPDTRAAYLDQACAADRSLRDEVESLLDAAERAPTLVDRSAIEAVAPELMSDAPRQLVGAEFGAYKIVRLIGAGGMGSVYLGRRADEAYEQEVAIKLIRGGLIDGARYRGFVQERQTLANLNHPGIARLLDGGRGTDGTPYLVMEYVDGEPIDAYCASRRLGLHERLRLFRQVCDAVQHAHQHLVVHRDLKPGNILVTRDGTPKLLDFGIAKVLRADDGAPATRPAATTQHCLTPEYASPEQVRGEPIGTASDVYSLGVVLYELLTGQSPVEKTSGSLQALANTVCEVDPERPSTAVRRTVAHSVERRPKKANGTPAPAAARDSEPITYHWRSLAGDLDAIVMKAMRKEPRHRYGSVEQLSDDIGRHLDGLPVLARSGTWRYRSAKFLRRHWAAGTAAMIAIASLVGATVVSVRSAWQAERDRDDAIAARRIAQTEAENARIESRQSDRVRGFLQSMLRAANPNREGPDVTVGTLLDQAAASVDQDVGDDPEIESAVRMAIGDAYVGMGRYPEGEAQLKEALELQRGVHKGDHRDVVSSLNALGILYHAKGDYAAAQDYLEQTLAMQRRVGNDDHSEVAQFMNNLAVVVGLRGDDQRAETLLREALAIRRKLLGDDHIDTAESLNNLAALLMRRRDYSAVEPICREVLANRRKMLGEQHPLVAQAIHNLGVVLIRLNRNAEGEPLLRQSIDLYRAQLGPDHPELAGALYNLGDARLNAGAAADAEPLLRESLEIRRRSLPPGDARTFQSTLALGRCMTSLKQYSDAEALLVAEWKSMSATPTTSASLRNATLGALADLYEAWGRPGKAAEYRTLPEKPSPAATQPSNSRP